MTSPPGETRSERTDGPDARSTARGMWETRPARDPNDRVVAGVAAAVARRYDVDPVLVRVVFVVGGFYGVGLLLYFVLWVVLPDRTRPGRTPIVPLIIAVFVGLAVLGGFGDGPSWGLVGVLLAGALLYALHAGRSDLGVASSGRDGAVDGVGAGDGAATSALEAPSRTPRPPRSPVAAVTLAAALVVGGLVAIAGLLGWVPLGTTPVVGSALAVIGVGLVAGAFLGAGRWLILAAVPLALVLVTAAAIPPSFVERPGDLRGWGWSDPWRDGPGRGDVSSAPTSAGAVAPDYRSGIGDLRLDLRGLPPGPPVTTDLESGVGDVTVLVGPTADVTVDCETGAGDVRCLGRTAAGQVVDLGVDGPGGPAITLRAQSGAGDVEVTRG